MEKDFDAWNEKKKELEAREGVDDFHEGDVWWCSIGLNVGREQSAFSKDFSRPILIVKRFTPHIFLGVPLTTKTKRQTYRFPFTLNGIKNDALVFHMREYDKKRLRRKIGAMLETDFDVLSEMIKKIF